MTFLQPADIPATCNSVEKIHMWSGNLLSFLYPNLTDVETTGQAERVIQDNYYYLTARAAPTWVCIQRCTLDLDPNWKKGTGKIWTYAQPIGTASIPPEFKA